MQFNVNIAVLRSDDYEIFQSRTNFVCGQTNVKGYNYREVCKDEM